MERATLALYSSLNASGIGSIGTLGPNQVWAIKSKKKRLKLGIYIHKALSEDMFKR